MGTKFLVGSPQVLVQESCAGFADTHLAALSLLFTLTVYASAIETSSCEAFWKLLLLKREPNDEESDDTARDFRPPCVLNFLR